MPAIPGNGDVADDGLDPGDGSDGGVALDLGVQSVIWEQAIFRFSI